MLAVHARHSIAKWQTIGQTYSAVHYMSRTYNYAITGPDGSAYAT